MCVSEETDIVVFFWMQMSEARVRASFCVSFLQGDALSLFALLASGFRMGSLYTVFISDTLSFFTLLAAGFRTDAGCCS